MASKLLLVTITVSVICTVVGALFCSEACKCASQYRADCFNASLTDVTKELDSEIRFLNVSHSSLSTLKRSTFAIQNIRQLKVLDLSDNKISTIETGALRDLESLIFLYLSRNEIFSLEQDVFETNRRLEFLKLDGNILLIDLPENRPFINIPSLRSLDMSSCNLRSLPEKTFLRVQNVDELRLSHNRLQVLPPAVFFPLKALKYLYLSDNLLKTLNDDLFVMLKNLEILDLSNNLLLSLHPEMFTYLKRVEHLDLSHNRLKTLDVGLFTPMMNLKRLHLHKNMLHDIDEKQFSELTNLTVLDLSGNRLDNLHIRVICPLNNLTYLKISDNQLACDCALWELWRWSMDNGIRILSTCEADEDFANNKIEDIHIKSMCNASFCNVEVETDFVDQIITPMYIYVMIGVGLFLVLIICGLTAFAVFHYRKEFCKRRNVQVSAAEYSHGTIAYVSREPPPHIQQRILQRHIDLQQELHHQHQQTLLRNRQQKEQSRSLRTLPAHKNENVRHSYHDCPLPSVGDDEKEWFNADTLPSNNRTSVFLSSTSSHPAKRQSLPASKDDTLSEPKPKEYPKNTLCSQDNCSSKDMTARCSSSLPSQMLKEYPKCVSFHDITSSGSDTEHL